MVIDAYTNFKTIAHLYPFCVRLRTFRKEVIRMKKSLPVILVLVAVGVGAILFMNRGKGTTPSDSGTVPFDSSESDTFVGTLKEAVARGVGMKCTYEVGGNEYEGYIKGKNYRGKIKTAEGKEARIIIKDNCMWTWAEDESQGVKTCFEVTEGEAEGSDIWEQPQGAVSPDITYRCVPFAVTDAQFTPPADVNFMDLESMMEGFGN
jgi:hypothetical protein